MQRPLEFRPQLDLSFLDTGLGTSLDRRVFRWPYTVSRTFRLDRVPAGMLTLIVQSASGSILAEDALRQRYHVGPGAFVHVTTAGAAPVYRAPGETEAFDEVDLAVQEGGFLEYLPEPRILFRDSSLSQRLSLRLAEGGAAVVSDAFALRDPGGAEGRLRHFASEIAVERMDGTLLALDRIDLSSHPRRGRRRERFSAYGTLIVAAPRAMDLVDGLHRDIEAQVAGVEGLYLAVSGLPSCAGASVRIAAYDGRLLRQGLTAGWSAARFAFFGERPAPRRK
jgi:urease accessory protein